MPFLVQSREKHEHNTDPQRRCYNGCHFSSERRWAEWETLSTAKTAEEAEERLISWRRIPMGSRKVEFRAVEVP